jgi:transposase-like protein
VLTAFGIAVLVIASCVAGASFTKERVHCPSCNARSVVVKKQVAEWMLVNGETMPATKSHLRCESCRQDFRQLNGGPLIKSEDFFDPTPTVDPLPGARVVCE